MKPSLLPAWIGIVLGVVFLTVAGGGGFFGLYVGVFRIADVAVAAAAIALWLIWAVTHPSWRPRSNLYPAILACLAALAISDAAAPMPRLGFDYLAYSVLLAGLYLLLVRLVAHPAFGPRLAALGIVLGFGLCLLYLGAVLEHWIEFWQVLGRFSIPPLRPQFEGLAYGNPSTVATVTILLWFGAAAHLGFSTRRTVIPLAVLFILTAAVVFLSGSRGAWAGLGISVPAVAGLWLLDAGHRRQVSAFVRLPLVRRALTGSVLLGALVLIGFGPALLSRLSETGADTRIAFYLASIRMFLASPLTGFGPGSWTVERIRFTLPPEPDYYIPHGHNIWLQTLAELGLVGVVAGMIMAWSVGRLILGGIRSQDPVQQRFGWAALLALAYLGAHQLFDFYPNMPAIGFCLALLVARLDAGLGRQAIVNTKPLRWRPGYRFSAAALAVGVLTSVLWLGHSEQAASVQTAAVDAANDGDWQAADTLGSSALSDDPGYPPYEFTEGLAAARVGNTIRARDLLQASALADDFPTAWIDVASLDLTLDQQDAAQKAISNALRLGYEQPEVATNAALMLSELGDTTGATQALADALLDAPGMASDPYWEMPAQASLFESALGAALGQATPTVGYEMAMEANRLDQARSFAGQLSGEQQHVAELEIDAWAGSQTAFDALHALAISDPLDDMVVAMCRRIAAHSRDPGWVGPGPWDCDGAGYPADLIVVRVTDARTSRAILPGPNSSWHIQYAYRRVSPFDDLVPGMLHLEVVFE